MTEQSPESQLNELRQMIAGMRKQANNQAFKAALDELLAQEATLVVQTQGTGTIVQGGHLEGGERSAVGSTAGGNIITGDNNTVNRILKVYLGQDGDEADASPQNSQTAQRQTDEATLRSQIASYLIWMRDQHSKIELRGIKREGQQVVQLDLETVYVPLAAQSLGQTRREIALDQVLGQGKRVAITGGPGSGKTTVLLHLAWTLTEALLTDDPALAQAKLGYEGDLPLPIFVPLSRYAKHLRDLPAGSPPEVRTLAGFISHYQIEQQTSFELPPDFFTELLRQGQAVILLLDGLDEVPNETERVQVRQAIENLVTGRDEDEMPVVVTCRTAAYQGRTALGKGFGEVQVMPLDAGHRDALIRQAYKHLYKSDPHSEQSKADELLAGISKLEADRQARFGDEVEPLVTSPLMVRMLLVVHYSERRLPDQRAELFMKATDTMLLPEHAPDEVVAEEIGSLVGGSREVHRELVQHLAFRMHERGESQGRDINEDELWQILDSHPLYGHLTDDFIGLTRLRGTVLEERLGVYRFIHLAFQEYLAARYLAEIIRGKAGIAGISAHLEAGPILDSWWREPALLGEADERKETLPTERSTSGDGRSGGYGGARVAGDLGRGCIGYYRAHCELLCPTRLICLSVASASGFVRPDPSPIRGSTGGGDDDRRDGILLCAERFVLDG